MTGPQVTTKPWATLLPALAADLRPPIAYPVRLLLTRMLELGPTAAEEVEALALAARRLLIFALEAPRHDHFLVIEAARAVCVTFDASPTEAAALLRRLFTAERLAQFGAHELRFIADDVSALAPKDPELVADLYVAAFGYQETSRETTHFIGGPVLPLTSNRRQDYEGGLYALAESYPDFIEVAPGPATRALARVVELVRSAERRFDAEPTEHRFDFDGIQARMIADGSGWWEEMATYRHAEPLRMLEAWSSQVRELAATVADNPDAAARLQAKADLEEIIANVLFDAPSSAFWRRLLREGAARATVFAHLLAPLTRAAPILTDAETAEEAGTFLGAAYPHLSHEERERAELVILSLPARRRGRPSTTNLLEGPAHRERLLGCLPQKILVTEQARVALRALQAANAVPNNRTRRPRISIQTRSGAGWDVVEEFLGESGIDVAATENRRVLDLARAAAAFTERRNEPATLAEASAVLRTLRELRDALRVAGGPNAPAHDVWRQGQLALAEACTRIANGLTEEELTSFGGQAGELATFVTDTLLSVVADSSVEEPTDSAASTAERADSVRESSQDLSDDPPAYSPTPRTAAADGLMDLASAPPLATPAVLKAVQRLSRDPDPRVRLQILRSASGLWETKRDLMWALLEEAAGHEKTVGVLWGVVRGALSALRNVDPPRVARLTAAVYDGLPAGFDVESGKEVRRGCASLFRHLAVVHAEPIALSRLERMADSPLERSAELHEILHELRFGLIVGDPARPDERAEVIRRACLTLLDRIVRSSSRAFSELRAEADSGQPAPLSAEQEARLRELASLLDGAGAQVYFLAKAATPPDGPRATAQEVDEEQPSVSWSQVARLYAEAGSLIDVLSDVGLAHLAHHLLETLEICIPIDPSGVFLRVAHTVRAGRMSNYQYDSLAQDVVVRIVERYLAEYRDLIEADAATRTALLDVLDIFVLAGWPRARQLSYRLDEVYR